MTTSFESTGARDATTAPMPSPAFMLAAGATAALVMGGLARLLRR
ncbi:MAG TPA: hypothetical protein VNL94_04140 [Candidatus Binatia bacterium]|nr:hypothetical protein [Candidatus Binatia bacterium]